MFTKEQSIVDQSLRLQNIFKDTLVKRIIPQVEEHVAAKYRALYLKEQATKAKELEASRKRPWVKTANPSNQSTRSEDSRRISIGNVSGMIDSVQRNESEIMAKSILSLDEIASTLGNAKIDSVLSETQPIPFLNHSQQ